MPRNCSKFPYNGYAEDFFSPDSQKGKRRLISFINAILQEPTKIEDISRRNDESRTLHEDEQCIMDFALIDNRQRLIDIQMYAPGSVFDFKELRESIVIHIVFDPVDINEGTHPHILFRKTQQYMDQSIQETLVKCQTHVIQLKFWENCSENSMLHHWMKFIETGELNNEDLEKITPLNEARIFRDIQLEKEASYREFEKFLNKPSYIHTTIANKYLSHPNDVQLFLKMMNNMSKSIEGGSKAETETIYARVELNNNFLYKCNGSLLQPTRDAPPRVYDGNMGDTKDLDNNVEGKVPHDVDSKEQDKARSAATFRYVVENMSQMKGSQLSPACYIRNLPWRILVSLRPNRIGSAKSPEFFLQCNEESKSTPWSCYATAELRLLFCNGGQGPLVKEIKHLFSSKEGSVGFDDSMPWKHAFNPRDGYIGNDTITLEVYVNAKAPNGVNSKEQDGARSEATFHYVVKKVSKMDGYQLSLPCYIRNLPWRIDVSPIPSPKPREQPYRSLGFFLRCNDKSKSTSWSCYATAELRLLPWRKAQRPLSRKFEHLFSSTQNCWGYKNFTPWYDLVNPEVGYIENDTITLEVHVQANAPEVIIIS